jgi:hypothetical protein
MMKTLQIVCAVLLLLFGCSQVSAEDSRELVSALKQGGYVVVFHHVATDDSQKDIYPFDFDDMKAQRQLSEKGREMARQISGARSRSSGFPSVRSIPADSIGRLKPANCCPARK